MSRAWNARPDDRLVGLLMIRDEDDVLAEMLASATRWFDRILVLDGTTDPDRRRRTDAILAQRPEIVFVARDEDVIHQTGAASVTDGARQVLLDEARRRYGVDQWIGLLHADEFIDQDPRPLLASHNPVLDPTIRVRLVHAFLHTDDQGDWSAAPAKWDAQPLRQRLPHVMWPGVPETRFFFDRGDRDYVLDHHSKTVPLSFRAGPLANGYCIVQYNERSPEQVVARARSRMATGWQTGHYARFLDEQAATFVDTLDREDAPFAPEFSGDPSGPFRSVLVDDVAIGPLAHWMPPRTCPEGGDASGRRIERLDDVVCHGGLLDLIDMSDRSRRMAVPRWRRAAIASTDPVHHDLVDHTAHLLASRRLGAADRSTVVREHVYRLHGDGRGWMIDGTIADERVGRLQRLMAEHKPQVS